MNNSEEVVTMNGADMPVDESLEEMMGAGVFYGRKKTKTHPRMKDFIFGNRGGIEIIDLYKTKDTLEEALSFLKSKVRAGGVVLFVGTQPMASGIGELAKSLGFPFVTNRWVGGTLTNFKTLSERIAYFRKLKSDLASGALVEKYTKKERVNFEKELQRLEDLFGGIREIERVPDVLVVVDPVLHETAVREGRRAGIPIIALANTDADPDLVDYAVIGNNKSTKSVTWFLEKIADAIREARKEAQAAVIKNAEGASNEEKKINIMSARAEDIQKLRETTGAGVMDCKKALEDANGDFASAEALVRERGLLKAGKRAGRETGAGHIEAYVHAGRIGVLLELRAETDFVVRSEPFRELAHELVLQIAATASANVEALLAEPYIKDESRSVNDVVNEVIGKVGEKVAIGAFHRIEV